MLIAGWRTAKALPTAGGILPLPTLLLAGCGGAEPPAPATLMPTATPNLEATVAAMVAAALPSPTAPPTDTPVPTATAIPTATPDIPATVSAELTRLAPTPTPAAPSVSDIVKSVEAGLVQIIVP